MKLLKSYMRKIRAKALALRLAVVVAVSALATSLAAAQVTLATTSIGGFNIVTDGNTGFLQTIELGSIQGALGSIFVVIFSLIAIFLGFRKLSMLFRRG